MSGFERFFFICDNRKSFAAHITTSFLSSLISITQTFCKKIKILLWSTWLDIDKIISYTHSDKKVSGNIVKFILLESIGNAIIRTDVSDDDMKEAFEEYMNGQ